jgi:hypothetical protein
MPSIRLGRGVRLTLGRRGVSVSSGNRWERTTVGPDGVRQTWRIPGTGLSYVTSPGKHRGHRARRAGCLGCALPTGVLTVLALAAFLGVLLR